MSQSWTLPFVGSDFVNQILKTDVNDFADALRTLHSGSSEPSSMVGLMLWADTTANKVKQRDAGSTAWADLWRIGQPANRVIHDSGEVGTVSASVNIFANTGDSARTVERVVILSSAGSTSSSGNEVTFQLRNLTQSLNLFSGTVGTFTALGGVGGGAEIVASTAWILLPDQNATIAQDDVLELQITYVGAPTATLTRFKFQIEAS